MDAPYREQLVTAYNALAPDWDRTHGGAELLRNAAHTLAGFLEPRRPVLEIGCATGRDAKLLQSLGFQYTGIDLSPAMVARAQANVPGATFQVADLFQLPFPDGSFYGFWANAVLLHVPKANIATALASIRRVVRTASAGFVSVKLGEAEGFRPDTTGHSRYFAYWERMEFLRMLSDNGWLQLQTHECPDPLGRPEVSWLYCYIMAT